MKLIKFVALFKVLKINSQEAKVALVFDVRGPLLFLDIVYVKSVAAAEGNF